MSLSAYQQAVVSDPAAQFVEALATNVASANYDLVLPGKNPLWFIRAFAIMSVENLDWELWLFSTATNLTGTMGTEGFVGAWAFNALQVGPPASLGYPVTNDPLINRWYIDGNLIPYYDMDQMKRNLNPGGPLQTPTGAGSTSQNAHLHVRLINRSAASKTAGAGGAISVTVYVAQPGLQA